MLFTTIVSAFFFDSEEPLPPLADLVHRVGMTDVRALGESERRGLGFHEPDRVVLGGTWGAFGDTWAVIETIKDVRCLLLFSSMNRYLDAQITGESSSMPEDGPLNEYIVTFRDACLALRPQVAFLDARSHYGDERWQNKQGNRDWVLSFAPYVAAFDINALADERFNLLYVGEDLYGQWTHNPDRDDRDWIDLPVGRIAFARSGPDRMV